MVDDLIYPSCAVVSVTRALEANMQDSSTGPVHQLLPAGFFFLIDLLFTSPIAISGAIS